MFVIKGKINTSRFFSYAASWGISRKTSIWQPLISRQPPHFAFLSPPPPPFLEKIFRRPLFPPILKKPNSPNFMRRRERDRTMLGLQLYHKRDSGTGVFLWILRDFKIKFFTEHLGRLLLLFFGLKRMWNQVVD